MDWQQRERFDDWFAGLDESPQRRAQLTVLDGGEAVAVRG